MTDTTRVLASLGAGIAGGLVIAATGNAALVHAADAVAPVGTLWVNAIQMTVIPLVVSLLVTGVASGADARAVGRLSVRTLAVFVTLLAGVAAASAPLGAAIFRLMPALAARPPLPAGAADAASRLPGVHGETFAAWLTSLVPPNPVASAVNGDMLGLIVFTLVFALALARTPAASRATVVAGFQAVAAAMLTMVRWVVLAAPVGVFALVLPMAAHAGASFVGAIGFFLVAYSGVCLAVVLLLYPVAAWGGGVSLRRFARAALPPQLIAFSTSSSIATLPALVQSAEESLAIPNRVSGFVLPLAVSTFHVAAPVSWPIGALFVGWFYGIPVHAPQLVTVSLAAVFLSFVAPGVPRGSFIMLAPLFLAIGLPAEGIGILIAIDALPDLFATLLNVTGDLAAAAIVGRLDRGGADGAGPTTFAGTER